MWRSDRWYIVVSVTSHRCEMLLMADWSERVLSRMTPRLLTQRGVVTAISTSKLKGVGLILSQWEEPVLSMFISRKFEENQNCIPAMQSGREGVSDTVLTVLGLLQQFLKDAGTVPVVREQHMMAEIRRSKDGSQALTRTVERTSSWWVLGMDLQKRFEILSYWSFQHQPGVTAFFDSCKHAVR